MPRVTIGLDDAAGIDSGFSNYEGPTPPKGVYLCKTKMWKLVTNSSGDLMFKIIFEINEPKGSDKAKFNGYAIWHNANLTKKSAGFVNPMLDALGIPRTAVWSKPIITSKDDEEVVVKIGGKSPLGIEVRVQTKRSEWPKDSDEWKLDAVTFVSVGQKTDDEEDAESDGDDEETSSAADDSDDEDESSSDDDGDDEDSDGEDDEDSF